MWSIHVVTNGRIPFFFHGELIVHFICIYAVSLFIHQWTVVSIYWLLWIVQQWSVYSSTEVPGCVCVCVYIYIYLFNWCFYVCQWGIAESYSSIIKLLLFSEISIMFSTVGPSIYSPISIVQGFPFLHILSNICCFLSFQW